jgi:hypothetical protein
MAILRQPSFYESNKKPEEQGCELIGEVAERLNAAVLKTA